MDEKPSGFELDFTDSFYGKQQDGLHCTENYPPAAAVPSEENKYDETPPPVQITLKHLLNF